MPVVASSQGLPRRLDVDSLDGCVGGRSESDGVDCYMHSERPRAY